MCLSEHHALSFRYDSTIIDASVCPPASLHLFYQRISTMNVSDSSPLPHFLFCSQELVSIGTEGRTGDLSVLGNVKHKMVCSPDFEALLESSA